MIQKSNQRTKPSCFTQVCHEREDHHNFCCMQTLKLNYSAFGDSVYLGLVSSFILKAFPALAYVSLNIFSAEVLNVTEL